jgi:hypothetical protein
MCGQVAGQVWFSSPWTTHGELIGRTEMQRCRPPKLVRLGRLGVRANPGWRRLRHYLFVVFLSIGPVPVEAQNLATDLALNLECKGQAPPAVNAATQRFLIENRFEVLDVARIRRERGLPPALSDVFVDGLDSRQRMVRFFRFPNSSEYIMTLQTPPPTTRSSDLETRIIQFVGTELGCSIARLERHENAGEAKGSFDRKLENLRDGISFAKSLGRI